MLRCCIECSVVYNQTKKVDEKMEPCGSILHHTGAVTRCATTAASAVAVGKSFCYYKIAQDGGFVS
jgi:hypothetical protein